MNRWLSHGNCRCTWGAMLGSFSSLKLKITDSLFHVDLMISCLVIFALPKKWLKNKRFCKFLLHKAFVFRVCVICVVPLVLCTTQPHQLHLLIHQHQSRNGFLLTLIILDIIYNYHQYDYYLYYIINNDNNNSNNNNILLLLLIKNNLNWFALLWRSLKKDAKWILIR